jgi:hypothetical protein
MHIEAIKQPEANSISRTKAEEAKKNWLGAKMEETFDE